MGSRHLQEVWRRNFLEEINRLELLLHSYSYVTIDTEFPGFLRNSPRNSAEQERYEDLKFNVDHLTLIQLGITLCDENGDPPMTWQFNFCNFNPDSDLCVRESIDLLKRNGIDLEKNRREGIDLDLFSRFFKEIIAWHPKIKWVTFHGLYDLAYMAKIATGSSMPDSVRDFLGLLRVTFNRVYDVKFIAGFCDGLLGGELGLQKLAKILKVDDPGSAHQAGYDSLLTCEVYRKMKKVYSLAEDRYEGFLYGMCRKIPVKIIRVRYFPSLFPVYFTPYSSFVAHRHS